MGELISNNVSNHKRHARVATTGIMFASWLMDRLEVGRRTLCLVAVSNQQECSRWLQQNYSGEKMVMLIL